MKKRLAFILALIMLFGTLFAVISTAEGEDISAEAEEKYLPAIAYANVNYVGSINMMFAVSAPTDLAEDEEVKLLVWNSRHDSRIFSNYDPVKTTLLPETSPVEIGGKSYLVFNFTGIDAAEMAQIICARPIVVKEGKAITYGPLVEYSVLEYIESAKGNIDGIEAVEDEAVIEVLDGLLDFGALAQQYSGNEYDFYCNEELRAIYVTPIVNGYNKGRSFVGFFKYEEGGNATITTPFFDGTEVVKITDLDGNVIEDNDRFTDGIQVEAKDADLDFVVEYRNVDVRRLSADEIGPNLVLNNYKEIVSGGYPGMVNSDDWPAVVMLNNGAQLKTLGRACTEDKEGRMNYWAGIKTIASPVEGDDGLVFQFTATTAPEFFLQYYKNKISAQNFLDKGFDDTIYPAITIELTLGAFNDTDATTGVFTIGDRIQAITNCGIPLFTLNEGNVRLAGSDKIIGRIPKDGMKKFAITIDALTGNVCAYMENDYGRMVKTVETVLNGGETIDGDYVDYESLYELITTTPDFQVRWWLGKNMKEIPEFESASIDIDGVRVPVKNSSGAFNMDAVQAIAERDYSFLMDDLRVVVGAPYAE